MKVRKQNIKSFTATLLLVAFAITLMPFAFFHHHKSYTPAKNGFISQKHFKSTNENENCPICHFVFEKDYINPLVLPPVISATSIIFVNTIILSSSYAAILRSSLRGPPVA